MTTNDDRRASEAMASEIAKVRAMVKRYGGTDAQADLVNPERCLHLLAARSQRTRREADAAELRSIPDPVNGTQLLTLHIDRLDARDNTRRAVVYLSRQRMLVARDILSRHDEDGKYIWL